MPPTDETLDRQAILELVGDDLALLESIVQMFHEQATESLAKLRLSIDAGDARGVNEAAHFFRSSIGNFSSGHAFEIASRLEQMGRSGDFTGAREALAELEPVVARLRISLDQLLQECR